MFNSVDNPLKAAAAQLKEELTIEQMFEFISAIGGEPIQKGENLVCRTICHGGDSHKLIFYSNTHLFKCYTNCENDEAFDVFELIKRVKERETQKEWNLLKCINFIAHFFGYNFNFENKNSQDEQILDDWKILNKKRQKGVVTPNKKIKLSTYDKEILERLPHPKIRPWEQEGISKEVMDNRGIAFDPIAQGIVIPHYDIDGNLVGIRERTLIKELEENGKYRPAILNKKMYNHPLSLNLYGIDIAKEPIKRIKKAILVEAEKSSMLYGSYFGEKNNICVACCGSVISQQQIDILCSLGVQEICIAMDRQFLKIGDQEWERLTKKLENVNEKYKKYAVISFIFDKEGYLPYKASPLDMGAKIFLKLFNKRFVL